MNRLEVVLHCSDSEWGNAIEIDKWHKARGWKMIGYHWIIDNGMPTFSHAQNKFRFPFLDGAIECGRPLDDDTKLEPSEIGAHCYGWNDRTIGICMIGKNTFTARQFSAAKELIQYLSVHFGFPMDEAGVKGHCELEPAKTCPNIDMDLFRKYLNSDMYMAELVRRFGPKK